MYDNLFKKMTKPVISYSIHLYGNQKHGIQEGYTGNR